MKQCIETRGGKQAQGCSWPGQQLICTTWSKGKSFSLWFGQKLKVWILPEMCSCLQCSTRVTKFCFVMMFLNRILLHRSLEDYHRKILSLFCKKTLKKSNRSQGQALTVIVRQLWPLWNVLLWVQHHAADTSLLKAVFSNMLKSWLLILIWYGVESTESAGVIFVMCCLLFHLLLVRDYQQGNSSSSLRVTAEYAPRNADLWDRPIFPSQPHNHCPPCASLEEKWRWKIRARGTERGKAEDDSGGESNPSIDCVCPRSPCEWGPSRGYTEMLKRWDTTQEEAVAGWKVPWDQMREMRTRRVSPPSYACKFGHWLCKEPGLTKQKDRPRAAGPDPSLCCSRFLCLTPPGTAAQSWEQRSSSSSEPAVQQHLTPSGWVTNLRLHPCSPRPGSTLGRF